MRMLLESSDYFEEDKKPINEIRSLVSVSIIWNGKNAFTLNYDGGFKVYNGSPEGFAKFLRRIGAKESSSYPKSARFKTYAEIVNDICTGKDPNIYVWSNAINDIPERIINENLSIGDKVTLEYSSIPKSWKLGPDSEEWEQEIKDISDRNEMGIVTKIYKDQANIKFKDGELGVPLECIKEALLKERDVNDLIGKFKGKYGKDTATLKDDPEFKDLSDSDKEVVMDELKETIKEKYKLKTMGD